jgi:hypothetical protein
MQEIEYKIVSNYNVFTAVNPNMTVKEANKITNDRDREEEYAHIIETALNKYGDEGWIRMSPIYEGNKMLPFFAFYRPKRNSRI